MNESFKKGFKAGAKEGNEIVKESAEGISLSAFDIKKTVMDLNGNINDIIDIIAEEDPLNRKEILENLKIRNNQNIKPLSYAINIIYTDTYKDIADDIRESLNQQGNCAVMQSYDDYKTNNKHADFFIILGMKNSLKSETAEILLNANGCHIDKFNDHIFVYTQQVPLNSDAEWKLFLDYYKSVTSKTLLDDKAYKVANNAREKRNKRDSSNLHEKILSALSGAFDKTIEFSDNLPLPLQILIGAPVVLTGFILSIATAVVSIPFGISEMIVKETINSLEKKDVSFINKAQLQILVIKICEFIRNQQLLNMVDKAEI